MNKSNTTTGSTVADVYSWLPHRVKPLISAGKLQVVQSVADLPDYLQWRGTALYHAAWHGSPHDHNKFDASKISAGEGAQFFGHGHYFTEEKRTAEGYRDRLSPIRSLSGQTTSLIAYKGNRVTNYSYKNPEATAAYYIGEYGREHAAGMLRFKGEEDAIPYIDKIQDSDIHVEKIGKLYLVELTPSQDEYLDWDKPLSEQSDTVKNALSSNKEFQAILNTNWEIKSMDDGEYHALFRDGEKYETFNDNREAEEFLLTQVSGEILYRNINRTFSDRSGKEASNYLLSVGIRGIRYQAAEGSSTNYVVFSDDDIHITAKYSRDLSGVEALYDERNDQLYLVADMLHHGNIQAVLSHELLHRAEAVDPKLKAALCRFDSRMRERFDLAGQSQGTAIEQAAYQRVMNAGTPAKDQLSEFKAYLVTEYQQAPENFFATILKIIQDFIAAIRAAILRAGMPLKNLTPADLNALSGYGARLSSDDFLNGYASASQESIFASAARQGYQGNDAKEAQEWLIATTNGLDMSNEARMERAKTMGFATETIWYHGGFSHFKAFDEKRSGSGTFNFAKSQKFAERYARTRSQDEQGDYDIVVRPFYLPKNLFDFNNKDHISQLESILPDTLAIEGRYGWAAFGGAKEYTKEALIEAIQGIQKPYTGLRDEDIIAIRSGKTFFIKEAERETVISYDPETDTVEYVPSWQMDSIKGDEAQIAFLKQQYGDNYWQAGLKELELKRKKEKVSPYKLVLDPPKTNGFDNWDILESPELRPYMQQLGFEGALMQERRETTVAIFDKTRIRSIDAAFDPGHDQSANIHFSYAGINARTADRSALAKAVQMEQSGTDSETIRHETGWFLGLDDKWRFEINDSEYRVDLDLYNSDAISRPVPLNQLIKHDILFMAYPELNNFSVFKECMIGANGALLTNAIALNSELSDQQFKSTLLHEIQHVIQRLEGFAKGGGLDAPGVREKGRELAERINQKYADFENEIKQSSAYKNRLQEAMLEVPESKRIGRSGKFSQIRWEREAEWLIYGEFPFEKLDEQRRAEVKEFLDGESFELIGYKCLAGEIEARDTQSRMGFDEAQRRAIKPYQLQGIRKEDAIVLFGDGVCLSFVGQNACSVNKSLLLDAQRRIDAGEEAEVVRQETGWFIGADSKWRFEISDAEAKLKSGSESTSNDDVFVDWADEAAFRENGIPLGQALNHKALFAAYPKLRAVRLIVDNKMKNDGSFNAEGRGTLTIKDPYSYKGGYEKVLSIILHELQHGIQEIEKFALGGNPKQFIRTQAYALPSDIVSSALTILEKSEEWDISVKDIEAKPPRYLRDLAPAVWRLAKIREGNIESLRKEFEYSMRAENPEFAYHRLAGEVEARNTQTRALMTDAERRATSPNATADVKDDGVIIVFNDEEVSSAPTP